MNAKFTIFLFDPSWPACRLLPSAMIRRVLMAVAMGITAVLIIHSPMGKRSGAHFNPAVTLTYLRLGKIGSWDAVFYVLFQFIGGIFGVAVAAAIFGSNLSKPAIDYIVTVPGRYGTVAAFFAELFMATVLMTVILLLSHRAHLAVYVSYSVGVLIALYTFFFAQVSGFSINPARTTGSAFFAGVWTAEWLYFVAPLLGMLAFFVRNCIRTPRFRVPLFAIFPGIVMCLTRIRETSALWPTDPKSRKLAGGPRIEPRFIFDFSWRWRRLTHHLTAFQNPTTKLSPSASTFLR
jgi:glycerol uptake facilitator-like aquaporin